MTTAYWPAPAAEALAAELISEHHPHLLEHRVDFLFRDPTRMKAGHTVLGTARKVSGLAAYLAQPEAAEPHPFFVIELAGTEWPYLKPQHQLALVDHELSHCWAQWDERNGRHVLSMKPHDLEDFVGIAERHGLWLPAAVSYLKLAAGHEQLAIDWEGFREAKATGTGDPKPGKEPSNVTPIKRTGGKAKKKNAEDF